MKTSTPSTFELGLLPTILTACAVAVGGALAAFFPLPLLGLYVVTLPVPLVLLWLSRDVETPQARIAAVDAERAKHHASPAAPPVAHAA